MTPSTTTSNRSTRALLRAVVIGALLLMMLFIGNHLAYAQPLPTPTPAPQPGPANPFDGVSPDLGVLGPALNSTWKRILAAIWGGCFAAAGVYLVTSFLKLKKARNRGMSSDLSDASEDVKFSLYCLAGVAAVSPIFGAVLLLVQPAA
ncbi:hypothetical protein [Rhodococcus sp. Eu-32]|uniref:hypothetical protein n=1 Tax=Rhodococcus sp. Eu-32 TaxID=1017319 RepID=UPI001A9FBF5C|nr:hypothetical protein [Rhodococcus sp. Eu-32]